MTVIQIVSVVVFVALAVTGSYNLLVRRRNALDNAFAGIDTQLMMRYDLIPNLVAVVKRYASHENETLRGLTQLRSLPRFSKGFFQRRFQQIFSGAIFVLPDRAEKGFGSIGQILQSWKSEYGQIVKLEDPEFERAFVFYSDSQIETRYILTPALMQRLLDFRRRSKRELQVSFVGSNVNIGLNRVGKLFESRLFRTPLKPSIYEAFWSARTELTGIVEELNLNTRIWTKA